MADQATDQATDQLHARIPAGAHTGAAAIPPPDAVAAAPAPTPESVADAVDGSLAARLRAKHAEIKKGTEQFDVPGWDGDLVVEVRALRDRKKLAAGMRNEELILDATTSVLFRDEDGELKDIGGWGGVGRIMGLTGDGVTLGAIVRAVLDNPLRLDGFAEQLIAWMMGRQSAIEQALGK